MWQRFTERARRVILLGQEEAGQMESGHVGTEHLLLGLLRENEGVAAEILQKSGVSLHEMREKIRAQIVVVAMPSAEPKLTPAAKHVLELAADEARRMRHNYIGTEHLLLALLREKSAAARLLRIDLKEARVEIMSYLGSDASTREGAAREGDASSLPQRVAALEKAVRGLREKIAAASTRESVSENEDIRALRREIALKENENAMLRERIAMMKEKIAALEEHASDENI